MSTDGGAVYPGSRQAAMTLRAAILAAILAAMTVQSSRDVIVEGTLSEGLAVGVQDGGQCVDDKRYSVLSESRLQLNI
jgi:hypothetical protein